MIFETSAENLRDMAAALNAARKRDPSIQVIGELEARVLRAIRLREEAIELGITEAQALRNILLQRAWDQRSNSEGYDYSDLADRIARALSDEPPPLDEAVDARDD
jgi:hypothetical protein